MPCSEKKRQANRRNALKSTGPKSPGGKAKVALNAVTHGLRSEHLALPGEDVSALDAMFGAWMGDWKPPTDARRVLVEQAVAHAWRLRRCLRAERLHLMERARDEVARRRREAERRARCAAADLGRDPASALQALLADRDGAEAVLGLWRNLAEALGDDYWDDVEDHHHALLRLLGLDPDEVDPDALDDGADASRWLVEWREIRQRTGPSHRPTADPEGEALALEMTATLSKFLAERVAEMERYVAAHFPPERVAAEAEAELALAAASAALDDSDEGRAILRYEGHHGRAFRATLNQLIKLTQTDADLVEGDPEPPAAAPAEVTQEPPAAPPAPKGATGEPPPAPPAPKGATEAVPPAPAAPNKATEASDEAAEEGPPPRDGVGDAIASFLRRVGTPRSNQ